MKKAANIALVLPRFSRYGGAEGFGYRLAEYLAGHGYGVDFVCGRAEVQPPPGVRVVEVGRFGPSRTVKSWWFLNVSERVLARMKHDLVINLGKTPTHDILRVGGGSQEKFWELSSRAYPKGFARSFKMLRRRLAPRNRVARSMENRLFAAPKTVVCVSHLVRDWLLEDYPHLKDADLRVVYNKPDLSRFFRQDDEARSALRRAFGVGEGELAVGTAGTNFALKGVATLIRSLTRLPENVVALVAGGRKPDKYLELARTLGVGDRVRFLGRVEDMPGFYNALDAFVLSTFYDACSNAVVEALACGCPAVSSVMNGSAVFVEPGLRLRDPADDAELSVLVEAALMRGRHESFAWPEDIACGLEPYLDLVQEKLREKGR